MKALNSPRTLLGVALVGLACLLALAATAITPSSSATTSRISNDLVRQAMGRTGHTFIPSSHKFMHVRYLHVLPSFIANHLAVRWQVDHDRKSIETRRGLPR